LGLFGSVEVSNGDGDAGVAAVDENPLARLDHVCGVVIGQDAGAHQRVERGLEERPQCIGVAAPRVRGVPGDPNPRSVDSEPLLQLLPRAPPHLFGGLGLQLAHLRPVHSPLVVGGHRRPSHRQRDHMNGRTI
jgi:hypothetical protein